MVKPIKPEPKILTPEGERDVAKRYHSDPRFRDELHAVLERAHASGLHERPIRFCPRCTPPADTVEADARRIARSMLDEARKVSPATRVIVIVETTEHGHAMVSHGMTLGHAADVLTEAAINVGARVSERGPGAGRRG